MAASDDILPPPPGHGQDKKSNASSTQRHVVFSEFPASSKKADHQAVALEEYDENSKHTFRPHCYACCAWGSLFVFAFFLLALIVGLIFVSIFNSFLPQIHIRRFNCSTLNFPTSNKDMSVKGKVGFLVEFWNKNDKTGLKYGPFKVTASSAHIQLANTQFGAFQQSPKSTKSINVTVGVNHIGVDAYDADQLKTDIKNNDVTLHLGLSGSVSFPIGGIHMNNIPIIASCDAMQREVDFGKKAKCDYRIFPLSR